MKESVRTRRVAELIRETVSLIIREDVNDPDVKDVVITDVKVTMDFSLARIYFTTYNKGNLGTIKKGLERSTGFISKQTARNVQIKKSPKLEFVVDDVELYGSKIDSLLSENKSDL